MHDSRKLRLTTTRLGLASALIGGGLLLADSPASPDHFSGANSLTGCGGNSPVNMADDATHYVWHENLVSTTGAALLTAYANIYNPLDTDMVGDSSNGPHTDLVNRDEDYTSYCGYTWDGPGLNYWGLTTCDSIWPSGRCDKHTVRYDNSDIDGMTADQRVGLACHETGHSFGLRHRDNAANDPYYQGCMYTTGLYKNYLSGHDRDTINFVY